MSRIDDFRSRLSGGGARPSQFKVMLTFPSWVTSGTQAASAGEFLIKTTSLPASVITPIEVPFRGRMAKIAGERQFANWNIAVINDNDFLIRKAMETWSEGILAYNETRGRMSPSSYTSDMIVQQLDRNDSILKEYKFFNCFPQTVGEIGLDFSATSQIEEFNVEFSIDYWMDTSMGGGFRRGQ